MKSFLSAVLAAAFAAAVVAAVSVAGGGTNTGPRSVTLHLVEKDQAFGFVDNAPTSGKAHVASAGDMFAFSANMLTTSGKRAGTLNAYCIVTRGGKNEWSQCNGTFGLAGGQIYATAAMHGEQSVTHVGIIGGTGAYAGARGEIVSVQPPNGNTGHDTFHLLLP